MPVKFSATPGEVGSAAPRLGEHSAEILRDLGYAATDIERWRQEQVISVGGA
jgi:crotonobetainyl-CoA:carnitine CoA-transferase CaiB-like acyl-CoA transferase